MKNRPALTIHKPAHFQAGKSVRKGSRIALVLCLALGAASGCAKGPAASQAVSSSNASASSAASQKNSQSAPLACVPDSPCDSQTDSQAEKEERAQQVRAITDTFIPMEFEEAIAFFENGKDGLLYFGFPDCPWCQEVVPLLEQAAKDNGIDVYYIQTRDDERNRLYTDSQKERIIPYISDYIRDNDEGVPTLYVPLVLAVKEGKVISGHQGTVEDHDAKTRPMSEEEKEQVLQDLEDLARTISQNSVS